MIKRLIASLLLLLLAGCGDLAGEPRIVATLIPPTPAPVDETSFPITAPNLVSGAQIFAQNCTDCHGAGGAGDGDLVQTGQVMNPGNMTDREAVAADSPLQWYNIITNGNIENLMPPWRGSLTEQQRWDVALYTYTLSYDADSIANGEAIFASLSNQEAVAADLNTPETAIQLTDGALFDQIQSENADLSDQEIWDAIAYGRYQTLSIDEVLVEVAETEEPGGTSVAGVEAAPFQAAISGEIRNGTPGGELPLDIPVTLFELNASSAELQEVLPEEDGGFAFDDVTIDPASVYVAGLVYRDRQFISRPLPGNAFTGQEAEMDIEIYELTEDPAVLSVSRQIIQVRATGDGLRVIEVVQFSNDSDRLFTSSEAVNEAGNLFGSTVLSLPPGAIVAGFGGNPDRYVVSDEDFTVVDTQPVLPGERHVMEVAYFLPYDNGAIIEHPLNYQLDGTVRLLVNPPVLDVESDQISPIGVQALAGNEYAEYGVDALQIPPGGSIRYELSGRADQVATTQSGGGRSNLLPTVLFVMAGITGASAVGLYLYGRRVESTEAQIEALVKQIAVLDDAHESGDLNHDVWHKKRNELKAKLAELMQKDDA